MEAGVVAFDDVEKWEALLRMPHHAAVKLRNENGVDQRNSVVFTGGLNVIALGGTSIPVIDK
jgi:hypothetical protein